MRFISLIIVVAIVYFAYARRGEKQSPQTRIAEAQREAAQVLPPQPAPAAQPMAPVGGSGVRAPIDRTRAVLEQVKARNQE